MRSHFILLSLLSIVSASVLAEVEWQQCGRVNQQDFLPEVAEPELTDVDVKADQVQLIKNGTSVFSGEVEVRRGGQELKANRATYNQNSGDITAQGNVQIRDSEIILGAQQAEWRLNDDLGRLLDAEYRLKSVHARGNASAVYRKGKLKTKLSDATYTTCNSDDATWRLDASNISLDHVEEVGVAQDVVLRMADIPIFYTPYLSFPLSDKRKSGFLTPSFGSSDKTGVDIQTPYYWNIAPDKDMTITPRVMFDRGLMLSSEFRYLFKRQVGKLDLGFLMNDRLKRDGDVVNPNYREDRKHLSLQYSGAFGSGWFTSVDYNYASDKQYLDDFGSNLSLSSTTHLNRKLNLYYTADNWKFTGRLQGYQTLTNTTKPYQRLPQLIFQGSLPNQVLGLSYAMKAEYVDFDHDTEVAGQRIHLQPSISLPLSAVYGYVTPRVAYDYTHYHLRDNVTAGQDTSLTRTAPILSVDSGLFFDREMTFRSTAYTQTLEPRLFYLHVPERNQDDIPVFDSGIRTFNIWQLFAHDRFSGSDRLGDTNQVSVGLTTRFINQQSGKETLRASIGQIHYLEDRKVGLLSTNAIDNDSRSDIVAEVVASIAKEWTMRAQMQWHPKSMQSNMSSVRLNYKNDAGYVVNLSHRYRRDNISYSTGLEQIDLSAQIPLNKQWRFIGRWYQSLKENRRLETLAGLEYDSCCWATRLVVRDYINSVTDDDRNLAVMLQVELKGLGNFGHKADELLQNSILGYDPTF